VDCVGKEERTGGWTCGVVSYRDFGRRGRIGLFDWKGLAEARICKGGRECYIKLCI